MLASRLAPARADLVRALAALRDTAEEVVLTPATVQEVLDGLWRRVDASRAAAETAAWWVTEVLGSDGLRLVPTDRAALVAAAQVRARAPHPPGPRRGGQTTPDQRVGWVFEIQIAACCWRYGLPLVSPNHADFALIGAILDDLYPGQPHLELRGSP
jgi:predicted nucleic acid-binding protein